MVPGSLVCLPAVPNYGSACTYTALTQGLILESLAAEWKPQEHVHYDPCPPPTLMYPGPLDLSEQVRTSPVGCLPRVVAPCTAVLMQSRGGL